jgi:hypothetical protein
VGIAQALLGDPKRHRGRAHRNSIGRAHALSLLSRRPLARRDPRHTSSRHRAVASTIAVMLRGVCSRRLAGRAPPPRGRVFVAIVPLRPASRRSKKRDALGLIPRADGPRAGGRVDDPGSRPWSPSSRRVPPRHSDRHSDHATAGPVRDRAAPRAGTSGVTMRLRSPATLSPSWRSSVRRPLASAPGGMRIADLGNPRRQLYAPSRWPTWARRWRSSRASSSRSRATTCRGLGAAHATARPVGAILATTPPVVAGLRQLSRTAFSCHCRDGLRPWLIHGTGPFQPIAFFAPGSSSASGARVHGGDGRPFDVTPVPARISWRGFSFLRSPSWRVP